MLQEWVILTDNMWRVIQEKTGSLYFSIKQKIKLEHDIIMVWALDFPLDCISCSVTHCKVGTETTHCAAVRCKSKDTTQTVCGELRKYWNFYSDKDLKRMI